MNEQKPKPVRSGQTCPKCNEPVVEYVATDFTNEQCTLVATHPDGRQCRKLVELIDAHQFEVRSIHKIDLGRKF